MARNRLIIIPFCYARNLDTSILFYHDVPNIIRMQLPAMQRISAIPSHILEIMDVEIISEIKYIEDSQW